MVDRKILSSWIVVIGILMCGTVLFTNAYDQALTPRHLIWCAIVIVLILCTDEIRIGRIHIFAFGYLFFVLLSGVFAINRSEWVYASSRAVLAVTYLSIVKIDQKLLTKAMILLGVFFTIFFWYDYYNVGSFHICRGLMRQKNYWSAAHFFVIPFCYNAITKGYWKKLSISVLISMLVNIVLLGARSVQLAVIVSAFFVYLWHKDMRKFIGFSATACIVSLIIVSYLKSDVSGGQLIHYPKHYLPIVFEDFLRRISLASLQQRIGQWQATLYMIKDNSFGVGAGNWWIMFPKFAAGFVYPGLFTEITFRHPHNNFIWIWAEIGLGVLFYIGMIFYAIKKADRFLIIALSGFVVVACFSALHERPFATLMLMTFIAMACEMKTYKQPKIVLPVLIFVMVVFGFRYRSSVWNKRMRSFLTPVATVKLCEGYSPFSTLTHVGIPWMWWKGISLKQLKRYEESIPLLKKSYEHNPYNTDVLNGIGMAYGFEKDFYLAEFYLRRSLKICPDNEDAKTNLKLVNKVKNNG